MPHCWHTLSPASRIREGQLLYFEIASLDTLRDHPLQRTQKAGCLTYVGAEGGGWCLPTPPEILELAIQQSPTRGDTDGTVPRAGRPRRELHAGGDLALGPQVEGLPGRDQRPGPGRSDPDDPGSQAPGLRGRASERVALRDAAASCGRGGGRGSHAEPRAGATSGMPTAWPRSCEPDRSTRRSSRRLRSSRCFGSSRERTSRRRAIWCGSRRG